MTTPDPNNPPPTPTVEELQAQLTALREFRAGVAKGFGLDPNASEDAAILSRITDTTAEVSALKSAAEASAVDSALREAFAKSGATGGHFEDFKNLAAQYFHVDPKSGKVCTKPDAPTPNVDPDTWCVVELRQRRPAWWPLSQGANARGAGYNASRGPDDSCFNPAHPGYSWTKMLEAEARYGADFADRARAKYRGNGGAR
jgi:hypothetical protein